ncbi:hypothetical protein ASPWEDRAFT_45893 [Aspergillus wentii DTO 134E9]|uniref:Heterokaryon incompatibility domain-containing protein n=1 Tax=Aspergillus wentii DTO 134E9 TaxID=1073089 RepID=A0A1L9R5Z4_ASPWE|nr:uncharacterized protein ASPWEDRAFT_45893 [Aspergillus wentii DTO 134E9]KAI9925169.1 hypothetical protein MW887_006089 [Aspergillus wentii]OJJ30342.1 hypothetical protein ASPWEDRAFT_45893 [Aspergillus wentii DTO 134E9]
MNLHLCLRCRTPGHHTAQCSHWHDDHKPSTRLGEEAFLRRLQTTDDGLCPRCTEYQILDLISTIHVEDRLVQARRLAGLKGTQTLILGSLKSLSLSGSCPLCRLIFRVFPDLANETDLTTVYYIHALPSYERLFSLAKKATESQKERYAIYLSVEDKVTSMNIRVGNQRNPRMGIIEQVFRAFALSSNNPVPHRDALNARRSDRLANFSMMRNWLHRCESTHASNCQPVWSEELSSTRMVDVHTRTVVPYPPDCRYIALSYVWGGVEAPGIEKLENHQLPQTIEDAIKVTLEMGIRFLWVDMLCVDQQETHQQAQQIAMMDRIYQGATITLVALSGDDADSGLAGVSEKNPRVQQGMEVIDGAEFLTVPPTVVQEAVTSRYARRAWTMQEEVLSHRRLFFMNHQVHFQCNYASFYETVDDTVDPAQYLLNYSAEYDATRAFNIQGIRQECSPERCLEIGEALNRSYLEEYTSRQMTNDINSLDAFKGLQSYLCRNLFSNEFVWGLPLQDFPQSLRWFHHRKSKPRRRPQFPSWSWAGWEGEAVYSNGLNLSKTIDHCHHIDKRVDMIPKFISIDGHVLTLEANIARLEIRTNPFSEAFVPETGLYLGRMRERDFHHPTTLPSGVFDFLVVELFHYRRVPNGEIRSDVYLLLLDSEDGIYIRRTKVRIWLDPGMDFMSVKPRLGEVRLK